MGCQAGLVDEDHALLLLCTSLHHDPPQPELW
jgi:hypothetical protein